MISNLDVEEIAKLGININVAAKLVRAGYKSEDIFDLTSEDLYKINGIGKQKAEQVLEVINKYKEENDTLLNYNSIMSSSALKNLFFNYVKENDVDFYSLKYLSIYSINTFFDNDLKSFKDVVSLSTKELAKMASKPKVIEKELDRARKYYYDSNKDKIIEYIKSLDAKSLESVNKPHDQTSLMMWARQNGYGKKLEEYLTYNDLPLASLNLSNRLFHSLKKGGINCLSKLILANPSDIKNFRNLGNNSFKEYQETCNKYIKKNLDKIVAYCEGTDQGIKESFYQNQILDYLSARLFPVTEKEIIGELNQIDPDTLKEILEDLKKKRKISINKNGISYAHPSFVDIAKKLKDEKQKSILRKRLAGMTLEEIGISENITRERVRQIETKGVFRCVESNRERPFSESKYIYLYEHYLIVKDDFKKYFNLSEEEYNAVQLLSGQRGTTIPDESSLEDWNLSIQIKTKLQRYLEKDFIRIRGERIPLKKQELRSYILKKYCQKDTTIEEFAEKYNSFLIKHNIQDKENLMMKADSLRGIENQFSLRTDVLWKQWKKFRYYDINSRDFSNLLEGLNLSSYENTIVSTEKLIKENKQLIKRYDIRDEYELHNLLKKIYTTPEIYKQYKQYFGNSKKSLVSFLRMPGIMFGSFDRDKKVEELVKEMAPIRVQDFASFLSNEFGYSADIIIANWFGGLTKYIKRNGIYSEFDFEAKPMCKENMRKLKKAIVEDFYSFDDLKKIYSDVCPEADLEEINSMNLKSMGYVVNNDYIISGKYSSMKEYLNYLIISNASIRDIPGLTKYNTIYNYVYGKQYDYEIIMYNKDDYITIDKLIKTGITKEKIEKFVDDIEQTVDADEYFNYKTIKEKYSYKSELDTLGFDDFFYNKILEFSGRFAWTSVCDTLIFKKEKSDSITSASFINIQAKQQAPIEIDNFIKSIKDVYGISKIKKEKVVSLLSDPVYYNRILNMIFENYESFSKYIEED